MHPVRSFLCAIFMFSLAAIPTWAITPRFDSLEARYSRAHSLGDNYQFNARDGWQTVNTTNLQYKYAHGEDRREVLEDSSDGDPTLEKRSSKKKSKKKTKSNSKAGKKSTDNSVKPQKLKASGGVSSAFKSIVASIKAIGKPEDVVITWYTGHDLENPSCWDETTWAPTDASFACALTLEGWTTRPKCFKFLELCNGPKKCVFVRVVDSCAGCAKGSKHVDLTRAAFSELADLDEGLLQVQMRQATDPDGWLEDLWGPKM